MLNQYLTNPAVAGTSDEYHVNAGFRKQWLGLAESPTTYYVNGHGHIGKEHERLRRRHKNQNSWHHGVGFLLMGDNTGPIQQNSLQVSYAYDFNLTKSVRMSFGASLGGYNRIINKDKLRPAEDNTNFEQTINTSALNRLAPDANAGVWVYHKLFYVGASINQILMTRLRSLYTEEYQGADNIANRLVQHYFVTGGGVFHPSREIAIIPSMMVRAVQNAFILPGSNVPKFSADLNCKVRYDNYLWGGLSYRNRDAFVVLLGIVVDRKYEIGYAYDYTVNRFLNNASTGSHEIFVGYRLTPRAHIISPSDFW